MPSAGESTYGNASRRSARTNASCSSRAPSLASTIPSQSPSRRATWRSTGRSVLQTGQVGERKKRSVLRPSAPGPPRSRTVPVRSRARTTGAGSPTAGPFPTMSAPAGATRSWSTPIWRASAATTHARRTTTSHKTAFETRSACVMHRLAAGPGRARRRSSGRARRKRPRALRWPPPTRKRSASAVRSVASMTGSMLRREEKAPGEARLGDLAQHGARHGVVDGHGGGQRRRGDEHRVLVLGDEDALDARVGENPGEQPAREAAAPRLLSDEAHQRVQHRDALHAPARREIVDPHLAARLLVGIRAALVHEGVEPPRGRGHGEVRAAPDAPPGPAGFVA